LIPATFLDQAGDLAGQVGPQRVRAVHRCPSVGLSDVG
jgi:hypothetical protein